MNASINAPVPFFRLRSPPVALIWQRLSRYHLLLGTSVLPSGCRNTSSLVSFRRMNSGCPSSMGTPAGLTVSISSPSNLLQKEAPCCLGRNTPFRDPGA